MIEWLSFRCILKPVHSSGKLRRFQTIKSHSLRVPTAILINGKKTRFLNESALGSARGARQYLTDPAFASPINYPPTRVDPMSIRPTVAELSSRDRNPCRAHFDVFDDSVQSFPHVKTTGKLLFFSHAPRTHLAPQRARSSTNLWPATSSRSCANFSPPLPSVWPARLCK